MRERYSEPPSAGLAAAPTTRPWPSFEAVEARRAELGEQYGNGEIGKVECRAALDALERREANARAAVLADARAEVDANVPLALIADGVDAEGWEDLPVATQRAVLGVLRLPIVIAPTTHGGGLGGRRPGIDEDRVSIGRPEGHTATARAS